MLQTGGYMVQSICTYLKFSNSNGMWIPQLWNALSVIFDSNRQRTWTNVFSFVAGISSPEKPAVVGASVRLNQCGKFGCGNCNWSRCNKLNARMKRKIMRNSGSLVKSGISHIHTFSPISLHVQKNVQEHKQQGNVSNSFLFNYVSF